MATLVPVRVAIRVLFSRECVWQKSGHMDTPVINVPASLHKYKMKLFPVWGQMLCDVSRSVLHFLGGGKPPACGRTSSLFSRMEGHQPQRVIEETGADALSLS